MSVPPPDVRPASLPTHPLAALSLVFGVLTWVLLPFLGAIVGIVLGHVARSDLRRHPGVQQGEGLALAGLALSYAQLVLTALGLVVVLVVLSGLAHAAHH